MQTSFYSLHQWNCRRLVLRSHQLLYRHLPKTCCVAGHPCLFCGCCAPISPRKWRSTVLQPPNCQSVCPVQPLSNKLRIFMVNLSTLEKDWKIGFGGFHWRWNVWEFLICQAAAYFCDGFCIAYCSNAKTFPATGLKRPVKRLAAWWVMTQRLTLYFRSLSSRSSIIPHAVESNSRLPPNILATVL